MQRLADEKARLAADYVAGRSRGGAEARKARDRFTAFGTSSSSTAAAIPAPNRVLSVAHYAQINGYFCGPASGKMILKYLQEGASAWNGDPQDQDHIGNDAHMRTWTNGATTWSSSRFRIGLNRWRSGSDVGFYVDNHAPTATEFRNAILADIDSGYPFGADTVEFYNQYHYNGHPNRVDPIGHWIVVIGYYDSGITVRFADPSTSVWSGASQYFNYATSSFATRFLQNNGIVW